MRPPDITLIFNLSQKDGALIKSWKRSNRGKKSCLYTMNCGGVSFDWGRISFITARAFGAVSERWDAIFYLSAFLNRTDFFLLASETAGEFMSDTTGDTIPVIPCFR
jgi:hypothetical protein